MRSRTLFGLLLLPLALGGFEVAVRHPQYTELWYAQGLYPQVVRLFAAWNRWGISVAEILLPAALAAASWAAFRAVRKSSWRAGARSVAGTLPWTAGILFWAFLLLWGFNYARPSLARRMSLPDTRPEAADVLELGRRSARTTASLFRDLGRAEAADPPLSFAELDATIDALYRELELPGDTIRSHSAPAKALASSELFSYLGISGIFVPFTGEASINARQPEVSLPLVLAHEKAHQRGITDEGEANFAAFLVCSRESAPLYLRYAAYLFATRHLLGEASRYAEDEEVREAWALLGDGPLADLRSIHEFWRRYQGRAMEAAARVNDRYLRAMRVEGGVESYGTVVRLLVALDARGEL